MRIYAILAHPKKDSFSGRMFYAAVKSFQEHGATVDVLDLYDHVDHIPFYIPSIKTATTELDRAKLDFFNENKERFMAADRLFIVYPVYWYAVPGILKCWLDLITNFAWEYKSGDHYAKPLHKIQRAFVINSASMSTWFRWLRTRNSASEMMKETFKFMGINQFRFYEIGGTSKFSAHDIEEYIQTVCQKSLWLIR